MGVARAGRRVLASRERRDAEIDAHARGERAEPGKRLRIIGNEDLISGPDGEGFLDELLTSAGQHIQTVNREHRSGDVEVFVHTPFRSDTEEGSRNSSLMGVQGCAPSGARHRGLGQTRRHGS